MARSVKERNECRTLGKEMQELKKLNAYNKTIAANKFLLSYSNKFNALQCPLNPYIYVIYGISGSIIKRFVVYIKMYPA